MLKRTIIGASAAGSGAAMPIVVITTPRKTRNQPPKRAVVIGGNQIQKPISMEIAMTTAKKPDFEKISNDTAAFGQDQMDAYTKAATLWARGSEEIIKTCVALTQQTAEKNAEAIKSLMGCKTLNELTEAQTKLAQTNIEGMIANATKLSELTVKVATDSFEPLNAQYSKTVKKAASAAA